MDLKRGIDKAVTAAVEELKRCPYRALTLKRLLRLVPSR